MQLAQASRKQDTKKVEKLAQNIDELESKLGPEYPALLDRLWNIDPTSQDAHEIGLAAAAAKILSVKTVLLLGVAC